MGDFAKPAEPDVFKGLPRRIHVGGHTYRVLIQSVEENAELENAFGLTDLEKFRIHLFVGMPASQALEVVQHEVSHVINDVFGVTDDSSEEQFTTQHSKGLIEIQLRNPRYVNWINKTLRRVRKEASRD
jgi:predicted mannosyl-3-phosphoglycerate phosphatase (HAD superfamily)